MKNSMREKTGNRGQALVEFALVLPLLLLLVFGITEFGRYLYQKNSATNAARDGARTAVVTNPWNETTVKNYVENEFSIPTTNTTIKLTSPTGTVLTSPTNGTVVQVSVRKSFTSVVPNIIPQFKNLTSIRASATMRYE